MEVVKLSSPSALIRIEDICYKKPFSKLHLDHQMLSSSLSDFSLSKNRERSCSSKILNKV
jgi:hypothetical protein